MEYPIPDITPQAGPRSPVINLSTLFVLVMARRRFVLGASLLTGVLLFCISLLLPNTYKATALVMAPDHSGSALSMLSSLGSSSNIPSGALAAIGVKSSTDLYVALMLSPPVEDAVIDRFQLRKLYNTQHISLARKTLEGRAQVQADTKTGIISVSVVDKNPQRAADIANGIVQAYDGFSSQLAITDAARRRLFFEHQVDKTKENLAGAEESLKETSAKTGITEPGGDARALISYESQLRAQIAAKNIELQSMKAYYTDENLAVQVAERELAGMQAQANALSRKAADNGSFSKASESNGSLEYARKLREVKYNESLFELLLKNLEAAKLDEAHEDNSLQTVSAASAPDLKDGPHRSFFLAGGFVLGFFLAVIWVLLAWARKAFRYSSAEPV